VLRNPVAVILNSYALTALNGFQDDHQLQSPLSPR